MIPEEKIAEVRNSATISEFISPYVTLKKKGNTHMGLCPFHNEKTPSFSVSDENGFYHCFGCGVGGNIFKFLMEIEGLTFPEAVRKVADRHGIVVPDASGETIDKRGPLYEANASAARYFHKLLVDSEHGRTTLEYLEGREIGRDAIDTFTVGTAPTSGTGLVKWLTREGVDLRVAEKLGLVVERGGRPVDRFRNRVMFPIRDAQGRVIGFGGRRLGDGDSDGPKYLNSPESDVYHKSRALYGIHEARTALRGADHIILVEGYLDVIALAQAGITNVVATCGTALTADQARMMSRYVSEVVTLFDGDDAGATAAARSFLPIFFDADIWAKGTFLPAGEDPDTFVRREGRAALEEAVQKAEPLVGAYARYVVANAPAGDAGLAQAASELAGLLGRVRDPFKFEQFVKKASFWTELPETALRRVSRRSATVDQAPEAGARPRTHSRRRRGAPGPEELLVTVMLAGPETVAQVEQASLVNSMDEGVWRELVDDIIGKARDHGGTDPGEFIARLPDDCRDEIAARLAQGVYGDADTRQQVVVDCLRRIEESARRRQLRAALTDLRKREEQGSEAAPETELSNLRLRTRSDT